jgi:hypothetical protein
MAETNNNVLTMPAPEQKPARFTIRCVIDGFEVAVEVEGKADLLRAMIDKLKSIGAQPAGVKTSAAAGSAPLCPIHNKPMKPSRQPGKFFCAMKRDDGEYCQEKQ